MLTIPGTQHPFCDGVLCVTNAFGFWSYHGSHFRLCLEDLPTLGQETDALAGRPHYLTDGHQPLPELV